MTKAKIEGVAMNIVHQIGDALYEQMPLGVAKDFVKARQATNDIAIYFAMKLITTLLAEQREEIIKGLEGMKNPRHNSPYKKDCIECARTIILKEALTFVREQV